MKEIKAIIQAYQAIDFTKTRAALATVARVEGSSYRRAGARMLVLDDGTYTGGISGGCLEGDALRRAQKAIAQNKPSVVTYDTTQEDNHQIGVGLGCNGIIDVLFTPLFPHEANGIHLLEQVQDTRTPRLLLTVLRSGGAYEWTGKSILWESDEDLLRAFGDVPGTALLADARNSLHSRTSRTLTYETGTGPVTIFLEVLLPVIHLVVYGGNYDIYPVVRMAKELGWTTTVVLKTARADKSLFAHATSVLDTAGTKKPDVDRYTALLLMEHDYEKDLRHLKEAIRTDAFYIGLLGPRKRGQKMLAALEGEGTDLSEEVLRRIHSPAGLDIGAASPEEIALSMLAEIQARSGNRVGRFLREREGTIHGD